MEVLEGLAKKGVTMVMSIHELELAVSVSDRLLLVYDDGKTLCKTPLEVMEEGLIKDLFSLTDEMYEKAQNSATQLVWFSTILSVILMVFVVIIRKFLIGTLF